MNQDDFVVLSADGLHLDKADSNRFYCYSLSPNQSMRSDSRALSYLKVVWSHNLSEKFSYECFYKGVEQDVKIKTEDCWALFDLAFLDEGLKLFAYASYSGDLPKSFTEIQDFRNLLILPLVGLLNQKWCDGICGHLAQGGIVCSMSPPGSFARVSIPFENFCKHPDPQGGWSIQELVHHFAGPEYLRISLVAAIGNQIEVPKNRPFYVSLEAFSLETAVCLLLLRQAFPGVKIQLLSIENFKNWHKTWKHLSNCLGMEATVEGEYHQALSSKQLARYIDPSRLRELAIHMNGPSHIFAGLLSKDAKH